MKKKEKEKGHPMLHGHLDGHAMKNEGHTKRGRKKGYKMEKKGAK